MPILKHQLGPLISKDLLLPDQGEMPLLIIQFNTAMLISVEMLV